MQSQNIPATTGSRFFAALARRLSGPAPFRCICGAALKPLIQRGVGTHREVEGIVTDIHHCRRCDHVQFAPVPSAEWLDDFYKRSEFWDAVGRDPNIYIDQWTTDPPQLKFIDLIQKAAKSFPAATKLHDFACGYGGLVKAMQAKGIEATGSDLSTDTIEFGQRLGLPISLGGIPELLRMEPQHIITSYHAAEHLLDPNAFLDAAQKTLAPGGFLILAFPNGAFAPARLDLFGRFDWCFFPAHIHYYTPRSISAAFRRHGLEVVSIESNSDAERGLQIEWVMDTIAPDCRSEFNQAGMLAAMDGKLQSRDLRVVGRKPFTNTRR